jgi:hypothetical protein
MYPFNSQKGVRCMQILTAWKDSLSIFYPLNNFKQFCLAVWQEFKITILTFFKKLWWLIATFLFAYIRYFNAAKGPGDYMKADLESFSLFFITLLIIIATYWITWHRDSVYRNRLLLLYYFSVLALPLSLFLLFSCYFYRYINPVLIIVGIPLLSIVYFLFIKQRDLTKKFILTLVQNLPAALIFLLPLIVFILNGRFILYLFIPDFTETSQLYWLTALALVGLLISCLLNLLYASLWKVFYLNRSKQIYR